MSEVTPELPISENLLAILRDPAAVQEPEKYGPDPGQLELVHNAWLVSQDTGYKYPIKDGIPIMLVEEGERWKDTPIDELPMPPESAQPLPPATEANDLYVSNGDASGINPVLIFAGLIVGILFFIGMWRWLTNDAE